MAMLAERKQKQRWSLNPRGKYWTEDVNKFGHKMLERMGWTSGKGLGANEDGRTEHIKISYKNDSKGMGFKDNGEEWQKHEADFTSLLANLGAGNEASQINLPRPDKSLEKISQSSRARVHYRKFTRGKDLSARSAKDIANIFGRKTLDRPVETIKSKIEVPENGSEEKSFGVVTVKAGNMADYFKSKLGKFSAISDVDKQDDESESGACTGFGFSASSNDIKLENQINFISSNENSDKNQIDFDKISFVSPSPDSNIFEDVQTNTTKRKRTALEDELVVEKKKSKKSKKKALSFDNFGSDINTADEMCYDNPCLQEMNSAENVFDNQGFDSNDELPKKKRVTFSSPIKIILNTSDEKEECNIKSKKKKKKNKKQIQSGIDNPACEENSFEELPQITQEVEKKSKKKRKRIDTFECEKIEVKEKKKQKKCVEGIDNIACEEISINEKNAEIKIYKLKKKLMENGIENPACEEISNDTIVSQIEDENSPKLKKKKKKSKQNGILNLGCDDTALQQIEETTEKSKTSKKEKKKQIEESSSVDNTIEDISVSVKKTKKSKTENGIENLGCEVNTIEENIASINSEIDNYQTELENEINLKKAHKQNPTFQNNQFSNTQNNRFNQSFNKKSLKDEIKSGTLYLNFPGSNLKKLIGYGADLQLRPQTN